MRLDETTDDVKKKEGNEKKKKTKIRMRRKLIGGEPTTGYFFFFVRIPQSQSAEIYPGVAVSFCVLFFYYLFAKMNAVKRSEVE
jgi:hypothetical protein